LDTEGKLIAELQRAGISRSAIDAAWPSWWSEDLARSPSGRAELRFALARRLGLEPKPLLGERVEFVWNDEARFKHLTTEDANQRAALASFGVSIGRLLVRATPSSSQPMVGAAELRGAILAHHEVVGLDALLATCWAIGVPVAYLRVFPLAAKSMHAMVTSESGRFAVLLGRDASYPAPVAFTLAHELGHAALGHLGSAPALVDLENPATSKLGDDQEGDADRFALELLTGSPDPEISTSSVRFNAPTLANAVIRASGQYRVEPGTLALCLAHRSGNWRVAMSSLQFIYGRPSPAWRHVNAIAQGQLSWAELGDDAADYLGNVMTGGDG
jgi:hypothetical protein